MARRSRGRPHPASATATANADPTGHPGGTPIPGKTPSQLYAAVGADAFAELTNNIVDGLQRAAPAPTNLLESYDAINPVTGRGGREHRHQAGLLRRPAPTAPTPASPRSRSTRRARVGRDGTSYCIDCVRSSRAKGTAAAEAALTFYAQSRDAVAYAVIGNAYAPTTPLTTAQLKDIFECTITDWSQVGGQAGPIHVYLPPASAATLTFFLQAIGTSLDQRQRRLRRAPDRVRRAAERRPHDERRPAWASRRTP